MSRVKSLNCTSCKKCYLYNLNDIKIAPDEIKNSEIKNCFGYFQYHAPNISSNHAPTIDKIFHKDILYKMLDEKHYKNKLFCAHNSIIDEKLKDIFLDQEENCLKCRRFVCKLAKSKNGVKETELECFLRHIRNSIAHGRTYYVHTGNRVFIVFEDVNNNKRISARIVCIKSDLIHWKKCLKQFANSNYQI